MGSREENRDIWNDERNWHGSGDGWSSNFGGTEALWWFQLYPRIQRYLPAATILEIAPGQGRCTQFLLRQCESMVAVDLSEHCINQCKKRFADQRHVRFHVNDGLSLSAVEDGSVDFVFSFDSLVHAEKDVIESYLRELGRKLRPDGVGFLHHSNMGAYPGRVALLDSYDRLPAGLRKHVLHDGLLERLLSINIRAWRARTMTAKLFREYCHRAGLKCVGQELLNWHRGKCLIDTMSVFTRPGSRWDQPITYLENDQFVEHTRLTARLARLYTGPSKAPARELQESRSEVKAMRAS
jgi:ubiquinone/menaquinone biosynthesis C-methylase UbiE